MNKVENPREASRPMSVCLKNGIKIKPSLYGNRFKITIEQPGKRPKTGEATYPEKTDKHQIGVYDKISSLYQELCSRLEGNKTVTNNPL